jgi:DNA-binding NarL/FixJ family response regulator
MARVLVLSADLMFGSRLHGALSAAGHDVELIGDAEALRTRLAETGTGPAALIVDLTDDRQDGAATLEELRGEDRLATIATMAFYSHVDVAVRERAVSAGFDQIVPRSRMAREAPELVDKLIHG